MKDQQNAARGAVVNPRKLTCPILGLTLALLLLITGSAALGQLPVPIVNAGFEDPVLSAGGYTTSINGWTEIGGSGSTGVWHVKPADFPAGAPEGANLAYIYLPTGGQGTGQVLSELFKSNTVYVLSVKVGNLASYAGDLAALCEIQMGMGDPKKHPEFKGTVASVETRGFARPVNESPSDFDYHWNHNGESHYLVGEAMGKAMLELLKSKFAGKGQLR